MKLRAAGYSLLLLLGGCVHQPPTAPAAPAPVANTPAQPAPPAPQSAPPATTSAPPTTAPDAGAAPPPPATEGTPAPAAPKRATKPAQPPPALPAAGNPPAAPSTAGATAARAATPATPAKSSAPQAAPASAPTPAAGSASRAPASLDLTSLEQRLRDTRAIGVFTKLSLKNQVDDLLTQFRGYHRGLPKPTLTELRQRYELLLLKVVSLLQDDDVPLATAVSSSREAIWDILADPRKFAQI